MLTYTFELQAPNWNQHYLLLGHLYSSSAKYDVIDFLMRKQRIGQDVVKDVSYIKTIKSKIEFAIDTTEKLPISFFNQLEQYDWKYIATYKAHRSDTSHSTRGIYKNGDFTERQNTDIRFWIQKLYEGKGKQKELKDDYLTYMRPFKDVLNLEDMWDFTLRENNIVLEK